MANVQTVQAADSQAQAKVSNLEGQVQVKTPPSTEWKNLKKDDRLGQGDEVLTGPDSRCEIALGDGNQSAIKINPDSLATLTSLDPVKIDLKSGQILSLVRHLKPGSTFQVSTPTAVAVARGTGWWQGKNLIKGFEGTIHLTGSDGQTVDVPAGKGITIDDSGHLGPLFDLSDEDFKAWDEFKKSIEEGAGDTEGAFGGDYHEAAGSDETLSTDKLQDIRSGNAEDRNADQNLQDKLNEKEPSPEPSKSPT